MAYFKINSIDFSQYVNKLNIQTNHIYNARTNASGNTSVKLINSKKIITVGIIPLNAAVNKDLVELLNTFKMKVEFLDPETNELKTANCILPKNSIDYYTIQADKVQTKAYILTFEEL
jgi:hypothetical protein